VKRLALLAVVLAALVATAHARADVSSQLSLYAEDTHGVSADVNTTDTGTGGRSSVTYNWPMANVPQDCSGNACGYARAGGVVSTDEAAGVLRATTASSMIVESPLTPDAGADANVRASAVITDGITLSKPATVWLEGTVHGTVEAAANDVIQLAGPNGELRVEIDLCCRRGPEGPVPLGGYEQEFVPDLNAGPQPVDDSFAIPVDLPAGWSTVSASVTARASLLIDPVPDLFLTEGSLLDGDTVTFHVRVPDDVVATSDSGLLPIVGGASADSTPPTSTATLADAPNAAGWNAGPTSVHVGATDDGSGVASITYTLDGATTTVAGDSADVPVTAEGTTTLTYFATDAAGNAEAPHTLAVRIDETPPTVAYSGNAGTYGVDDTVSITCAATDATSGVASTTCADVDAPAYTFGVGTTTLSAQATDAAGNVGTGSAAFAVTVDGGSLARLTVDFVHGSAPYRALDPRRAAVVDRLAAIAVRAAERRLNVRAYDAAVRLLVRAGWLTAQQGALLERLAASV
jgi:hypothetical protein